jgi:hypothetical protein
MNFIKKVFHRHNWIVIGEATGTSYGTCIYSYLIRRRYSHLIRRRPAYFFVEKCSDCNKERAYWDDGDTQQDFSVTWTKKQIIEHGGTIKTLTPPC